MTTEDAENAKTTDIARPAQTAQRSRFDDLLNSLWDFGVSSRLVAPFDKFGMRIEETVQDGVFVVRAEIPGVDPDKDIDIVVDDGVLTITATRESRSKETREGSFKSEFSYGRLVRQTRVPKNAELEAMSASYNDGILEVRIPLAEGKTDTSRRIPITRE